MSSEESSEFKRAALPIDGVQKELLDTIAKNQVVVITGDTGSGKSTQLAQLLDGSGAYTGRGRAIVVTQPRRIGAVSLARRVAQEMGTRVGDCVGYTIRFDDQTSERTRIKYATDGIVLRECLQDSVLDRYSVVILDEAHERSLQTDILFGLVRGISARRNDIKIIVMSATLDTKKFTTYFGCPSFHIPGRCYPVQVFYAEKTKRGYMKAAVEKVVEIHTSEPLGHVLVFLTGQDEIERACALLGKKLDALYEDGVDMPDIVILPMYAALTSAKQQRIFHETAEGCRKVVISTNICETSLTVDGIAYVVDPGFAKQKSFDATTGIDSLVVSPISKVAAEQRKGRAGRTREGKCYRLYTEEVFRKEIPDETLPEIQRTSLSSTALMLKSMKIDPLRFEYLDPPDPKAVVRALRTLWYLGALDDAGSVTRLGNLMNRFPLEPSLSKLLVLSLEAGVEQEILTIAAMLTVENIWINPRDGDEKTRAQGMRARFASRYGDHITFLCVYDTWEANRFSRRWCEENYIHFRAMRQAKEVRRQLTDILKRQNDALREYAGTTSGTTAATGNPIEKCLYVVAKCFFMNAARRQGAGNEYKPVADPVRNAHFLFLLFPLVWHLLTFFPLFSIGMHAAPSPIERAVPCQPQVASLCKEHVYDKIVHPACVQRTIRPR